MIKEREKEKKMPSRQIIASNNNNNENTNSKIRPCICVGFHYVIFLFLFVVAVVANVLLSKHLWCKVERERKQKRKEQMEATTKGFNKVKPSSSTTTITTAKQTLSIWKKENTKKTKREHARRTTSVGQPVPSTTNTI